MIGWTYRLKSVTSGALVEFHENADFAVVNALPKGVSIIDVGEEVNISALSFEVIHISGLKISARGNEVVPIAADVYSSQSSDWIVALVSRRIRRSVGTVCDDECPIGINNEREVTSIVGHGNIAIQVAYIESGPRQPKIWSFAKHQSSLGDVGLAIDTEPLKNRDANVNDGDIDDCPAGRRWPPPFLIGLILCAGGLLFTCYGAKRFNDLCLEGRLYNLWWTPFVYVIAMVGCRLMALKCWWF